MEIDARLVAALVADQFPQWRNLDVQPVGENGWDNRSFRLGRDMLVRMPSAERYAAAVMKEQEWLPRLAAGLPLAIPRVQALGQPGLGYPWCWSVYGWIKGQPAIASPCRDEAEFAATLAGFLTALQGIPATGGPSAGEHNFHRGGDLAVYEAQMRAAIDRASGAGVRSRLGAVWEAARGSRWQGAAVWIHGDLAPGNLLMRGGRLHAVIDFGQLGTGDPACDLVIAWTTLGARGRKVFRDHVALEADTWARARGWAAWKAAILLSGVAAGPSAAVYDAGRVLTRVLDDAWT